MEIFIALLLLIISLFFTFSMYKLQYWQRRGIPHNKPKAMVGNMIERNKKHVSQILIDTYKQFKGTGPFAGFYFFVLRSALVLDIELVRKILIDDFEDFRDRYKPMKETFDPLTGSLYFLEGDEWQEMRRRMTPAFTVEKIQSLFPTVAKVGQELAAVFCEKASLCGTLEVTDLLERFAADVIGNCVYGLECNALRNAKTEFITMGKQFLNDRRYNKMMDGLIHSFPDLIRKVRSRIIQNAVHDFYMRIVHDTIAYREKHQIKRNDYMDMFLEMKRRSADITKNSNTKKKPLTQDEIGSHAFAFFIAGFETSSTTMGFALYELAQHKEIQNHVREEINNIIEHHKGEITYECVCEMQYLGQVVDEILRMYPVVSHLIRRSHLRYETSDPKYYIDKNTTVVIPSIAIHYDSVYYPEPYKFKPERFCAAEIQKRPSCTWLPFGAGPRNCIAMHFAKMQICIGLVYLLRNLKFSTAAETEIPIKLSNETLFLSPENGIRLRVKSVI